MAGQVLCFVSKVAQHEHASAAAMAKKAHISSFAFCKCSSPLLARHREKLSRKGPSSCLTTLPLIEHGFHLSRQDFWDGLAI